MCYLVRLLPSPTPSERDPNDAREGGAGRWAHGLREAVPYVGLGTGLAFTVLAGLGAGLWLDGRLGTEPWFLVLGGSLGVGAALLHFFRTVSGPSKRQASRKR